MTSDELRELYKTYLDKGKQKYIASQVAINGGILSRFKNGKLDLYPDLHKRLEKYLLEQTRQGE